MSSHSNDQDTRNTWICLKERKILSSPVMEILERDCKSSEDERTAKFYLLKSRDWCNIIPITEDGKVVLVKQFRIGISDHTLEIPGGVSDPEDTDMLCAAIREMTEETGYVPLPHARSQDLGWSHPNPAILNNRSHFFVVGPVSRQKTQNLDHGEMIEVVEVPISELGEWIAAGKISHALTLNALFALMIRVPQGLDALRDSLLGFTGRE